MLTASQLVLLAANLIAALLLVWKGGRPERIAAVLILALLVLEPLAYPVRINAWRVGGGLVNLVFFLGLVWLAERWDRWWLVFVAAFQLLLIVTFLMPLMTDEFSVRTGIAIRLGLWAVISLLLFFGAWEAWADRRFVREGAHHANDLRRGGRPLERSEK